ncbi:MAG: hypothetical protein ACPGR7_01800 [Flavobacteriaceae bacterium]
MKNVFFVIISFVSLSVYAQETAVLNLNKNAEVLSRALAEDDDISKLTIEENVYHFVVTRSSFKVYSSKAVSYSTKMSATIKMTVLDENKVDVIVEEYMYLNKGDKKHKHTWTTVKLNKDKKNTKQLYSFLEENYLN